MSETYGAATKGSGQSFEFFRNLLKDQKQIVVLGAPQSFERELAVLRDIAVVRNVEELKEIQFSLAFVTKQKEVDAQAKAIARRAKGDAVVWFAYPKGSSKKYKCEFNRDNGWAVLGKVGFEPVRMVAIDADRSRSASGASSSSRG